MEQELSREDKAMIRIGKFSEILSKELEILREFYELFKLIITDEGKDFRQRHHLLYTGDVIAQSLFTNTIITLCKVYDLDYKDKKGNTTNYNISSYLTDIKDNLKLIHRYTSTRIDKEELKRDIKKYGQLESDIISLKRYRSGVLAHLDKTYIEKETFKNDVNVKVIKSLYTYYSEIIPKYTTKFYDYPLNIDTKDTITTRQLKLFIERLDKERVD